MERRMRPDARRANNHAHAKCSHAIALAAGLAGVFFARNSNAQRIAIRGEFGAGTMLSPFQTQTQGYTLALQGTGRLGISIIDPLAVQVSFSSWFFPRAGGDGQLFAPSAGLRFEPRIGRVGRFFVDVNAGPGWTPDRWRVYLDAGLGFEFMIKPWFGLGPVFRYGHFFHANETGGDAQFWSGGLSIVFRPGAHDDQRERDHARAHPRDDAHDCERDAERERERERERDRERARARERERERDTDHDGVRDIDDRCPNTPDGRHPDPSRHGCPLPDDDDDGIADADDRCPHTAAGHHPDTDRPGCPDGDADDDDVRDHDDQCPHQADGLHPDPARPGCPLPDRDGDNVPDIDDACPTRGGSPSSDHRRNGCPGLVRVENTQIHILQPVFFAPGHERILPQSQAVLIAVADALRASPRIRHLSIDGHTDETGDPAQNLDLSRRRAESVRDWLVAHGIDRDRLEPHGLGETRPIEAAHTLNARALNRRVEFHIVSRH